MLGISVRIDSRARRRVMMGFYALLLFAAGLAVLIIVLALSSSKSSDHLAVIANVLAGGTLLWP